MNIAVFSTKSYDRTFFEAANAGHGHTLVYFEPRLTQTTCTLAAEFPVVCAFVNDQLDAPVLRRLAQQGTRLIALRCAGFNNVDLAQAQALGLTVARVPAYSSHAVAEHTVGLILALNRKIHRAHARVREGNFSLDGLLGFDLCQRTVGVVGTGKIGALVAQIMHGFGCRILAYDPFPSATCQALGVQYVSLDELFVTADIVTLHVPLTPETSYLIDAQALSQMKPGVMLINTSRGALIDTRAVIQALKSGNIGYLGLDVYEEEAELFFEDLSDRMIHDDVFTRLLTFPNVIITGHQGFFTAEALTNIAETTLANVTAFARGHGTLHEVSVEKLA
jgi:D-lactate dehydrogenase